MKKIILIFALIFASSTLVNAKTGIDLIESSKVTIEDSSRFCVDASLAAVEAVAFAVGQDIRGENQGQWLELYMAIYTECVAQQ